MKSIIYSLKGTSALLMHADHLANPLREETKAYKALTSKKKKTAEDQMEIARIEYHSSFYLDESGEVVVIPTVNLRACLIDGAKLNKLGTAMQRGTSSLEPHSVLEHDGPDDWRELFNDQKFVDVRSVVVGRSRVMRYRPIFYYWRVEFEVMYDESVIDVDDVTMAMRNAGNFCGLGDFRPAKKGTFGRFDVEVVS